MRAAAVTLHAGCRKLKDFCLDHVSSPMTTAGRVVLSQDCMETTLRCIFASFFCTQTSGDRSLRSNNVKILNYKQNVLHSKSYSEVHKAILEKDLELVFTTVVLQSQTKSHKMLHNVALMAPSQKFRGEMFLRWDSSQHNTSETRQRIQEKC